VWIKNEPPLNRWGLDVVLEMAWEKKVELGELLAAQSLEVPVSVVYKDYNELWYRSRATMTFTYLLLGQNRIGFGGVRQERLGTTRPLLQKG
jgi:hypothetical protein